MTGLLLTTSALALASSALSRSPTGAGLSPIDEPSSPIADPVARERAMDLFHNYLPVFAVAFVITLLATPLMRKLAVTHGIVDRPSEARKVHRIPIAYLGGVAVFLGLVGGIFTSYLGIAGVGGDSFCLHESPSHIEQTPVPMLSVVAAMAIICITGLIDDVKGLYPRLKVAGQLMGAAFLAMEDVGTKVAAGVLKPTLGVWLGNENLTYAIDLPFTVPFWNSGVITLDVIYWVGVVIIAMFVLGACNASNLIDGLDGLLSGVTAIAAVGLLVIALGLAVADDGRLDSARIVMCMALLGACLGFLPHNFNPANIFLGDAGSLLLGYMTIVIILTLGDTGKTHLVLAGLVIFMIPIIDTTLAIVRRKLAGKPMSAPDDQHLHHQLKRSLGVKGAVFSLYAIGTVFAVLGIALSVMRLRVSMTLALVFASFIGIIALKIARKQLVESHAVALHGGGAAAGGPAPEPPTPAPVPTPTPSSPSTAPREAAVAKA
ncbi:MAG: glycosyltransferase family 4 protein [Phycisphaerales bacterium]